MGVQTEIIQLTTRTPSPFGEFLVEQRVLDRFQLFRTLQLQDRERARLGDCAVALGYVPHETIEQLHERFAVGTDLDNMTTDAFHREPDIEIVYSIP